MTKITALVLVLSWPGLLQAQNMDSFHFSFNHVAISVEDVDRSATFYKEILKLQEISNRSQIPGIRWFSLQAGQELHLISVLTEAVRVNKAVHLAVGTSDFDAFVQLLKEKKVPFSDWPGKANTVNIRADGVKQIFFQDPDGYWIEVNSELQN
jgi:catechol 2,3-dioxygenase-like lactoylglutathione lyase family enzyme